MQFLSQTSATNKRVLVRLDLDLPEQNGEFDTSRMEVGFATLAYLREQNAAHVTIIAHRGHNPQHTPDFSLEPIATVLFQKLHEHPRFSHFSPEELYEWIDVKENLRFDTREEEGSDELAKELSNGYQLFVNDAFATAHRKHTSITFIPKFLPTVLGLQFEKELSALGKVTNTPELPYVFILGGAKLETKLPLLEKIIPLVDYVFLGGKLAIEAHEQNYSHPKVHVAEMTDDTLDICEDAVAKFSSILKTAKTIVWNGPMGKFEDGEHGAGTKAIAEAIAESTAFSFIGGGDTEAALTLLGIDESKFSHISSGGGAMMHYLTYRTLPALEVFN